MNQTIRHDVAQSLYEILINQRNNNQELIEYGDALEILFKMKEMLDSQMRSKTIK